MNNHKTIITGRIPPHIRMLHSLMQKASTEVERLAEKQLKAIGRAVRRNIIIPFCDRIDCDYETSNGDWSFHLRYPLPRDVRSYWDVGSERRQLPSAPDDPSTDEDTRVEITDEERLIAEALDSCPPWASGRLSWYVKPYKRG